MPTSVQLGKRLLSKNSEPYIIAEIGVNHEGSVDLAKLLIDQEKRVELTQSNFKVIKQGLLLLKFSLLLGHQQRSDKESVRAFQQVRLLWSK